MVVKRGKDVITGFLAELERATRQREDARRTPSAAFLALDEHVVSASFRKAVLEAIPLAGTDEAVRRLVAHLLFRSRVDFATWRTLLPAQLLARMEEVPYTKHYRALDFLEGTARQALPGLTWSERQYRGPWETAVMRQVVTDGLPLHLRRHLETERRQTLAARAPLVYFHSGVPYSKNTQTNERARRKALAEEQAKAARHPATRELLAYLNGLSQHVFTKAVERNAAAARTAALSLPKAASVSYALALLDRVEAQPQPFYKPADTSVRVFTSGSSLLGLPRKVRAAITDGWIWFDLASAQLAIIEKQWDVPELRPYLPPLPGESRSAPVEPVWDVLMRHLGDAGAALVESASYRPDDYADVKGALKKSLYAVIFGASKQKVARFDYEETADHDADDEPVSDPVEEGEAENADANTGPVTVSETRAMLERALSASGQDIDAMGRRLIGHPIFKALFARRGKMRATIKKERGATDVFGERIDLVGEATDRSILAQLAQAQELWLLWPVLERARKPHEMRRFKVVAWLHDGFAIHVSDKAEEESTVRLLCRDVNDRAAGAGMRTYLNVER